MIEMTPVRRPKPRREIIANGAVGAAWAARWKIGRYEVCRWRDGAIPDVAEAVDSPQHMTADASSAYRLLELLPALPTPVWGRDELETGDVEFQLGGGVAAGRQWRRSAGDPPDGGSAPGWAAGLAVAQQPPPRRRARRAAHG